METSDSSGARPWAIISASIGGLLVAIAAVGLVAVIVNERVKDVTERALGYDVELEDRADDLRVAVLDLRHYHRNIAFGDPSDAALANHHDAYVTVLEAIDHLEALGVASLGIAQPPEMRELVEQYYADFRAATPLHGSDPAAFARASDEGLRRIQELERMAQAIDTLGERLTAASFSRVDEATTFARLVLLALLGGVALVCVALAVSTGRILARIRTAYAREQAATQELARTLRTKTDFIADASHELRTPLTVIRGNAEIGLATPGERVHREVLEEISTESTRMSRLVEDLLFLARSDAGTPPLEREIVPVRWLLSRLAEPAEVLAQQHGACLTARLDGAGHLEVDHARIEQAVLILVDNAAKHSPPDSCVSLASRVRGEDVLIEVADAGPGIPPDELPLIFDRFYQIGQRRARKKGGSGLGLSIIAKTIVEAHGGAIGVDSRPHHGTRMTIRLPLAAAPAPAGAPHPDTFWTLSLPRRILKAGATPAVGRAGEPRIGSADPAAPD